MASPASSRPTSPSPSEQPSQIADNVQATSPYRFSFGKTRGPGSVFSESFIDGRVDFTDTRPESIYGRLQLPDTDGAIFASTWSSSSHGFNAISTVLNNPRKSAVPLKSSRAPLPPAVSPDLPRVRRKDFDDYITAIKPAWDQFSRHNPAEIEADDPFPSRSKGKGREIPPLSSVPPIYFDPSFDLRSPRTFASVTEQDGSSSANASVARNTLNPEDISLNQVLQEKLSHYMDVVEQHLTREIQSRSTSFFAALTNLQDLQTEGADCLERIGNLRKQLEDVDTKIAKKGLHAVRLQKRRSNLHTVERAVSAVKEVTDMMSMCERLIADGNWDEALGLVSILEEVASPKAHLVPNGDHQHHLLHVVSNNNGPTDLVNSDIQSHPPHRSPSFSLTPPVIANNTDALSLLEPNHSVPLSYSLSSLTALASLPVILQRYSSLISESLCRSVIDLLREDLLSRYESSPTPETLTLHNEKLRERLAPPWKGLIRTAGVHDALVVYREMVLASIRSSIRKSLPKKADLNDDVVAGEIDSAANKSMGARTAALADDLRQLTHLEFLDLMRSIYRGLWSSLEGIAEHLRLFDLPDLSISTTASTTELAQRSNREALDAALAEIMPAATELANSRLSKVVSVRAEQHAALALPQFLELFEEGWAFVVKCEVMARKMIVGLRGVMVSQAKSFLLAFHATRLTASATLVENEVWAQVEVTPSAQRWADLLVESAVADPSEFSVAAAHSNGNQPPAFPEDTNGSIRPASNKQLLVESRPYFVVGATLKVIEMLLDYLRIIVNFPLLTTDAMARTIEYLKAFNSRTCQVVLGAGAMRSAGLKNITAKHLALASQSLSVMIALIPYVRETFRRHLNPKQAVMLIEFDKLKRDYHEHQNEIHSKLVAIMGDRLTFHCKTLHNVNWDESVVPSEGPNMYMKVLMKETLTLHKVLSKYLSSHAVEFVMSQVFAAINHRMSEEYGKIELPSQQAKDRLLQDALYLHRELSGLKDVGAPSAMLETIVREKPVPLRRSPFLPRRVSAMVSSGELSIAPSESTPRSSISTELPALSTVPGDEATGSLENTDTVLPRDGDGPPEVPAKGPDSLAAINASVFSELVTPASPIEHASSDVLPPPPLPAKEVSPPGNGTSISHQVEVSDPDLQ